MDQVSAAYIGKTITLFTTGEQGPDKEALTEMLKKYKITVGTMEKTDTMPF